LDGPSVSDSQLVLEARNGSAEAFGELYERYAPAVFRFLSSQLQNSLDAEDMVGEVFLKAWRALPGFRDRGAPFSAFLFRIAHNSLIDHYRTRPHRREHLDLDDQPLPDPHPEPMEQMVAKLDLQELRRVLSTLREDYRTVLVARYISDLTHEETALMMGRSAGAVRVLQHRALTALRKQMNGYSYDKTNGSS
jgi:RNA polymerase sigma-70 factor, ECF subfamily